MKNPKLFEDVVLTLVMAVGLVGGVAFLIGWPQLPSLITALFWGLAVSALVYRFLGGIGRDTSVTVGAFKFTGSLAALLATAWLIDGRLDEERKEQDARVATHDRLVLDSLVGRWQWQWAGDNQIATFDFSKDAEKLKFDGTMIRLRDGQRTLLWDIDDGRAELTANGGLALSFAVKETPEAGGRSYRLESVEPLRRQLGFKGTLRVPRSDPRAREMGQFDWGIGVIKDSR